MKRRGFLSRSAIAAAAATLPRPLFGSVNSVQLPSANTVHVGGSKRIDIGEGTLSLDEVVGNGDITVLLLHRVPGADHG